MLMVLLVLAGVAVVAYLISSATSIVLPAQKNMVSQILRPIYFGEVPIIFWLLLKGARVPPFQPQPSQGG